MSDLNKVIITGRLTRDPELKTLSSGVGVADFSLLGRLKKGRNVPNSL